ncbi:MAG: hypothetical protein JRG67_08400 [Deltaproteobacteria bacterium]|nr:hypothetical protein [Deltaproteobacteria bacterium]MBW1875129.1 hypothetical protein [Deltaproteobacteria bacterium]MBW2211055.1 hypothetical protein [Deltaproteobacteria bacterium]MBW2214250.1 hypothetical protein [Deltaproteobacteria bacterium]MBW2379849.1 hypothetical protein [Deltaproteobacteria bacterium]
MTIAWGLNTWRQNAAEHGLDAAREGDRSAAERWVDRALRESKCQLHEARGYISSSTTRQYVRRPDYVETFVEKLYADGAPQIEICDSDALGFRFAHYLVVTLPDDSSNHERIIADAQSFVRRDAVVYRGVTSTEVEEIVRTSTLLGKRRVLVDLPAEAD